MKSRTDYLAPVTPGGTTYQVIEHLCDVLDAVDRDLVRAPEHQLLMRRAIHHWIIEAQGYRRANLDRAGRGGRSRLVVDTYGAELPAPSKLRIEAKEIARLLVKLRSEDWLAHKGIGAHGTARYRPQIGSPFGVASGAKR